MKDFNYRKNQDLPEGYGELHQCALSALAFSG